MREKEEDDFEEYGREAKKVCCKYVYVDLLKMMGHGYIQVPQKLWAESNTEDRDCVMAYNLKIRYRDDQSQLEVPSIFKELLKEVKDLKNI
eukprot:2261183-Ditylum_brightwellii.AAC.1